jgi:hypothetical protein
MPDDEVHHLKTIKQQLPNPKYLSQEDQTSPNKQHLPTEPFNQEVCSQTQTNIMIEWISIFQDPSCIAKQNKKWFLSTMLSNYPTTHPVDLCEAPLQIQTKNEQWPIDSTQITNTFLL